MKKISFNDIEWLRRRFGPIPTTDQAELEEMRRGRNSGAAAQPGQPDLETTNER